MFIILLESLASQDGNDIKQSNLKLIMREKAYSREFKKV